MWLKLTSVIGYTDAPKPDREAYEKAAGAPLVLQFIGKVRQNLAPIVGTILWQSMVTHTSRSKDHGNYNA